MLPEENPDVDDETVDDENGQDPKEENPELGLPESVGGVQFGDLPKATQDEIRGLRAEAQKLRAARNQAVQSETARKKLLDDLTSLLGGGKELTVDQVQEQLSKTQGEHRQATVELAVLKAAGRNGADPDALLDSRSFLKKLDGLDPAGEGFTEAVAEAIREAVKGNPKLTAGRPATRSGGVAPAAPLDEDESMDKYTKLAVNGRRRFGF